MFFYYFLFCFLFFYGLVAPFPQLRFLAETTSRNARIGTTAGASARRPAAGGVLTISPPLTSSSSLLCNFYFWPRSGSVVNSAEICGRPGRPDRPGPTPSTPEVAQVLCFYYRAAPPGAQVLCFYDRAAPPGAQVLCFLQSGRPSGCPNAVFFYNRAAPDLRKFGNRFNKFPRALPRPWEIWKCIKISIIIKMNTSGGARGAGSAKSVDFHGNVLGFGPMFNIFYF